MADIKLNLIEVTNAVRIEGATRAVAVYAVDLVRGPVTIVMNEDGARWLRASMNDALGPWLAEDETE
ncbi:hypothetical protein ACWCXC_15685 [Streptomyces sp. NPDC001515]